jgi:hypothetical protein
VLTASRLPGEPGTSRPEVRRTATPGAVIRWTLHVPRQCTGVWDGASRIPCPPATQLPHDSTDSQCAACAGLDRGRQIARDAALGDDDRTYVLYLAWFGPGLIKIGLTAADRGRDRLLEQGAIAFTPLAAGPYTPIRQAERLASGTGLAQERISSRGKATAWWNLPPPAERAALLADARDHLIKRVTWPGRAQLVPCTVTDQAADFGLDRVRPGAYTEVTGIHDNATISGEILLVIGRHLLLQTAIGLVMADMRRAAGWAIRAADIVAKPSGLSTVFRSPPREPDDLQASLF